jgi:HK97 family phage major capsid protein
MARTVRRRRYEVTEMYALIDISNQMFEDSAFDMEGEIRGLGARRTKFWRALQH